VDGLGASVGGLGLHALGASSGGLGSPLGSWDLYVGGLGSLLGPMWTVLGRLPR
jgi:hypothetical protein